jgi:predicted Zn-dependent protease
MALLAQVYNERYEFAKVVELLAPIETDAAPSGARTGDVVRLLVSLGGARQQLGDTQAAVRTFVRARALLPEAPPLAAALAQAYLQARQFDDAERVARDGRKTAPDDLALIRIEALAAVKAGRVGPAVAAAEQTLAGRRGEIGAAFVLADVYQEARRFDLAIKAVSDVAAGKPDDDAIAFRLGAAYETAGRVADAERTFRGILARDPLNANTLNYLGYMLANRNLKVAEALALVDRALVVEPANPAFLDSRGWALFKLGRAADAEEPLRQAASALRGNSVIQSHYAEVLVALGKHGDAAAALDLALAGDGEDVDRTALERRRRELDRRPR